MGEFDLIDTYFRWDSNSELKRDDHGVVIGVGDDAAVLQLDHKQQLVTSIDTLISGVHFPHQTSAAAIAHKALSVNLSDLAAMGAHAKWFTLALTMPSVDHVWLKEFSTSLRRLAINNGVSLVGGDTTCGPLSISIQVMGMVEKGASILRSSANVGDRIFVTGTLGDANVGLASVQNRINLSNKDKQFCEGRLNFPTARLTESNAIKQYLSSCIDLSDGLLQDLGHILKKSAVSATIDVDSLPLSESLKSLENATEFALKGGDDYELLFTVAEEKYSQFVVDLPNLTTTPITMIGEITDQYEVGTIRDSKGVHLTGVGYNHFDD